MRQSELILLRFRDRAKLRRKGLLYEPNYIGFDPQEREFEQFIIEYTAAIRAETLAEAAANIEDYNIHITSEVKRK